MIWHYDSNFAEARYWVNERELRDIFLKKRAKRADMADVRRTCQMIMKLPARNPENCFEY